MEFHKVTMSEKYACIISKQNWYCLLSMTAGKSSTYRRNSVGPSTEPCGTPRLIKAQFETVVL